MNIRRLLLAACALSGSSLTTLPAAADQTREGIVATFLLARGRAPSADELRDLQRAPTSPALLFGHQKQELQSNAAAARETAVRAFEDAFGRAPTTNEDLAATSAGAVTYAERLGRHIQWLGAHPDDYQQVINRAYELVIRRPVYPTEIEYWNQRDPLPFVLLVGCVEGWARRNAPGLMATTGNPSLGVNSSFLQTLSLAPTVAAEVREATGLLPPGDTAFAIAAGRTVIAPGADQIGSLGGMFVVVVGTHELIKG